jgi:hypothetical protein
MASDCFTANERPSGSARGVPRKRYPYRDLKTPAGGILSVMGMLCQQLRRPIGQRAFTG